MEDIKKDTCEDISNDDILTEYMVHYGKQKDIYPNGYVKEYPNPFITMLKKYIIDDN